MFKFLKLRNSVSGDARRHVPFTSIIHKQLYSLFALVFSFVIVIPVKVNAAAHQLTPEFQPIYDTDIVTFQDSYLDLNPAAQSVANILFGAYITEYAGLADFGTVFDSVPTDGTVWDRLEFIGEQFIDTIFLPVNAADQLLLSPIINLGQGICQKVKSITSLQNFKDSVSAAPSYGIEYSPEVGNAINQIMAKDGGLFKWQQYELSFAPFNWQTQSMSSSTTDRYNAALETFEHPLRFNNNQGMFNCVIDFDYPTFFSTYHNIFINSSNREVSFVDDFGNRPAYRSVRFLDSSGYVQDYYYINFFNTFSSSVSVSNLITQFYNYQFTPFLFNNSPAFTNLGLIDFRFLYGSSFSNSIEISATDDLGFADTDSLQYLNPIKEIIFDLKGLIEEITEAAPQEDVELPLKPIIYNITQNILGTQLDPADLEGLSFNVTPSQSGIDIPAGTFLPMFDNGHGFIYYMWYMTKPLISYSRSLLEALTFDPVDGFNASGPGYFILGVAGLGLIGGVIVKFLL